MKEVRMLDGPVAVIGGGTMGCGVAQSVAAAGFACVVLEPDDEVRSSGPGRLRDGIRLARLLGHGAGDPAATQAAVRWTAEWADVSPARFVVECAPERIPLKEELFQRLDETCRPDAVFASCTSAIPISRLAARTGRPSQVLGIHFMNPVPLKPAVEVASTEQTGPDTVDLATQLLGAMGKKAILVQDAPGFVSNRVLMATVNDAATVVQEGTADAAAVDEIFQDCFGHKMGPLATADLIGLDTIVDTLHALRECTGDERFVPCDLLADLVRQGHLGRKTGRGFHVA